MALVLRVLVAGDCSVAEGETRTCTGSSFTIGRGVENDWVVADPQRHLSKQHCRIELRGQTYVVIDTSTNGVFVSGSATPLGRGNAQPVDDGDVISLGPCALRLEIDAASRPQPGLEAAEQTAARAVERPVPRILSGESILELPLAAMLAEPRWPEGPPAFGEDVANAFSRPPADWQAQDSGGFGDINETGRIEAVPVPPPTARPQPAPAPPVPGDLLASFLAGAGLPPDAIEAGDAADMMLKLGQAFREAVGGLRELLELRAFLKSEFRIEHTLLRAKENNPLKFSANLDGTLSVLLGRRVPGFMAAPEAIRESVRDVKAHEVALIAGLRAVVNDMLEQLSPEEIKSSVNTSLLQQVYKARCWEKYEKIHQRLAGDQNSGPPLGSQFSKAYTKQFKNT